MSFDPPEPEIEPSDGEPPTPTAPRTEAPQLLLAALRSVLRPLVRLLLEHGISFQQATKLLKQVYVDIAAEEIAHGGGQVSASRLSLVTGIHRKEVKRLHENPPDSPSAPRSVALGAQLVERWTSDPNFLDATGQPLALTRKRAETDAPGFDDLVRSLSTDIHPRAVLDEWLRIGIARIREDERIELVTAAFVPREGFEEKAFYFGRNLHDHLDVAARNLAGHEAPLLERSVHYSALSRAALDELADLTERVGMRLLETVNRRARALQNETGVQPESASHSLGRMNFGLYFYRDSERQPVSLREHETRCADTDEGRKEKGGTHNA